MSSLCHHIGHLTHQQRTFLRMNVFLDNFLLLLLAIHIERVAPFTVYILVQQTCDGWQRLFAVTDDSDIRLYHLVYLGLVNIEMNHLSLRSILGRNTRDTVAESHTDGYQHITLLRLHVGGIRAMHTEHTHIERMIAGQS